MLQTYLVTVKTLQNYASDLKLVTVTSLQKYTSELNLIKPPITHERF